MSDTPVFKLRWRLLKDKVWRDFVHSDGTKDGGYTLVTNGERVLEYFDPAEGCWKEVPEE